jgi:2-(1,2-epoxy-1,2-dihydrophenyl)acetyl-CoA isomerase
MCSAESPVLLEVSQGVGTITLNRPQVLNALNNAMSEALFSALQKVEADDSVRAIVIRGAGDAFMAGGDIGYFQQKLTEHAADKSALKPLIMAMVGHAQQLALTIRRLPKPVIASIHGGCAGFGLSLAIACDLAIAADNAKFTLAYVHLGTTPDGAASFHLPRTVGQKRAAEIALLGDRFGAVDAERWGLVNKVVPLAELPAETAKLAARLARGPALAYARTKALLEAANRNSLVDQLQAEADAFAASAVSDDFAIGVSAFLEKKPPAFTGK